MHATRGAHKPESQSKLTFALIGAKTVVFDEPKRGSKTFKIVAAVLLGGVGVKINKKILNQFIAFTMVFLPITKG